MKRILIPAILLTALAACEHAGSDMVGKFPAFQPPHEGAPCVASGACD